MRDKMKNRIFLTLFSLLGAILFPLAARADYHQPEKAPKPIVLLMVDTSASMSLTADKHNRANTSDLSFADTGDLYTFDSAVTPYLPECNSWTEGTEFLSTRHYEYSRFMEVIQYLIGDIKGLRPWDAAIDPNNPSHLRYMCQESLLFRVDFGNSTPPTWMHGIMTAISYSIRNIISHGINPGLINAIRNLINRIPGNFNIYIEKYSKPLLVTGSNNKGTKISSDNLVPDGLIQLLGTRARVGIMFTDNDDSTAHSFGPDVNGKNYGVNSENASFGATLLPPDTDNDEIIEQQNSQIMTNLLIWLNGPDDLASYEVDVPHGGSPIGSMLADAYYYFQNHPNLQACTTQGQTNCDRYHDCRPKYVVLFTDGFMNIDDNSVLQGTNGWPKRLHDLGVTVIVVTPDGSARQLYETDANQAYTNVMGKIAYNGGSHWVAANGWGQGHRFIFGMPEFDPGVDSFYPNDTDGTNNYAGRESMMRNIGRPYLANLLGSGSMINGQTSKMCSNRRYISDLAFTDETMPTTDLAGDPDYIDHYAGVIAGGFYQRGFKLAWQDQVDLGVAGNLGNNRITMFGAPYDDGGMHLTFYSCKNPLGTDHSVPGVGFSVDTDSRDWRYNNSNVDLTDSYRMKLYAPVYHNNSGFIRELIAPVQPPDPADMGVDAPPWTFMNMAFRSGDEDFNISTNWNHDFGSFINGLGQTDWESKFLNIHTGGSEIRWIPKMDTSNPLDPMMNRRMKTLISFLAGRPLQCENNSDNTHQDSNCGGGFGYVNTGWYAYGAGTDKLQLYNYLSRPTGNGGIQNMLVRFGPTGHFGPVFVGHLQHNASPTAGFTWFKEHIVNARPTTMYVQTRDGILHEMAINALPGETPSQNHHRELWRFLPGSLLDKVREFQIYGKTLSDGPISVAPVLLSKRYSELNETAEDEADRWRIVLVAGIGYNDVSGDPKSESTFSNGVYALDVTDPLRPHLLWEITNKKRCQGSMSTSVVTCYSSGEENNYGHLGYTTSKPVIGTVHIGDQSSGKDVAVAIFGAGAYPLPPNYTGYLNGRSIFIVNLETGQKIAEIGASNSHSDCSGIGFDTSMISGLSCFPTGPAKLIRQCVAVDDEGKLWLLDLTSGNTSNWKAYMAFDPYQSTNFNIAMGDPRRMGTFKAPILTRSYGGGLYAIYASETSILNSIDDLSHINFVAETRVEIPQHGCPGDLPKLWTHFFDLNSGERVQGRMAVFGGTVYMTTYTPAEINGCIPGTGKIISVSAMEDDSDDWKDVNALEDSTGTATNEVSIPNVIPQGLLLTTLPTCVQSVDHKYYSTNLPGGNFNVGSDMSAQSNPEVVVPMGSADTAAQLGPSGHNPKAQTNFLPAKVINGGNGGGMKAIVIPTSWSLIFD